MTKKTNYIYRELNIGGAGNHMFYPVNSTMDSLKEARKRMRNPVWKDIYAALLKCRKNILIVNPED